MKADEGPGGDLLDLLVRAREVVGEDGRAVRLLRLRLMRRRPEDARALRQAAGATPRPGA
jgi:hypothetical protein